MTVGRGFETIISGYDESSVGSIFVHNTDDGYASAGSSVWTQNAKLVPNDQSTYEGFGKWMVAYNQVIKTIIYQY
jgi:hypothetical protein